MLLRGLGLLVGLFLVATAAGTAAGEWTEPPEHVPTQGFPDGPLLGNGGVGVVLGGNSSQLVAFIAANHFWGMMNYSYPHDPSDMPFPKTLPIGRLGFSFLDSEGRAATDPEYYHAQQLIDSGEVRVELQQDASQSKVVLELFVDPTRDLLFVEVRSEFTSTLVVSLSGAEGEPLAPPLAGCSPTPNCVKAKYVWAGRAVNHTQSFFPITALLGMRPVGNSSAVSMKSDFHSSSNLTLQLSSAKPIRFVIALASSLENPDVHSELDSLISLKDSGFDDSRKANREWWSQFWMRSSISLDPRLRELELFWNGSQYIMALSSRPGRKVAPGLWGPFTTTDNPSWHGDYTMNYNFEAPFYGVYSSNHAELADPYYASVLVHAEEGRVAATKFGCTGIHLPVHLAPWGKVGSMGPSPFGDWKQRSAAAFAIQNMISHWQYYRDSKWLLQSYGSSSTIYELILEVAQFWECYLKQANSLFSSDYTYKDKGDCNNEGCDGNPSDVDPIVTLSLIRRMFQVLPDMTGALGLPCDRCSHWTEILSHLAPFPVVWFLGDRVWDSAESLTELFPHYLPGSNPLPLYPIWPGEQVSLHVGSADDLAIGQRTLLYLESWANGNGYMETYPAAVRVMDNETIDWSLVVHEFVSVTSKWRLPNLLVYEGGGGLETAGATQAVNDLLMQSHEGFINVFPLWDSSYCASFRTLRAKGGFLVSATFDCVAHSVSDTVELACASSGDVVLQNPWPAKSLDLIVVKKKPSGDSIAVKRDVSKNQLMFRCHNGDQLEVANDD